MVKCVVANTHKLSIDCKTNCPISLFLLALCTQAVFYFCFHWNWFVFAVLAMTFIFFVFSPVFVLTASLEHAVVLLKEQRRRILSVSFCCCHPFQCFISSQNCSFVFINSTKMAKASFTRNSLNYKAFEMAARESSISHLMRWYFSVEWLRGRRA